MEISKADRASQMLWSESDSTDDAGDSRKDSDNDAECRDDLKWGDYVVVQLKGLSNTYHHIAVVHSSIDDFLTVNVKYLDRQIRKVNDDKPPTFGFVDTAMACAVPIEDIVKRLPNPMRIGRTKHVCFMFLYLLIILFKFALVHCCCRL